MAHLYNVKIKSLDRETKSITVLVESIHPDAIYFSDNLGFSIRLLYDSVLGNSLLSNSIDNACLFNKDWMQHNVRAFIESSQLLEIVNPSGEVIKYNGSYSFWTGEVKQASVLLQINCTNENWIKHLTPQSSWKSSAYDLEVDFKAIENKSENSEEAYSSDYENSGGWLLIPTTNFFPNTDNLPAQVYYPKFSIKSYRKANKFSANEIDFELMEKLLYKTVYILTRNRATQFGILLPYQDQFCVKNIRSNGHSNLFFKISEIFTINETEFNKNDSFLVNVFE